MQDAVPVCRTQVAAKQYKLLRMALDRSSKVAVAKYAWSGRERLGLLRVRDDVIVLHAMAFSQIIEAKREHREPPKLKEPESELGQIVDLMAALNESVQKARASRGEGADVHELPTKKTAKKQPAKKTAAKKTATKKAAAKKTSGRRPRSA
jgi:DNA end-binding protein Ku